MARIPLPRRAGRSLIVFVLLFWLGLLVIRRLNAWQEHDELAEELAEWEASLVKRQRGDSDKFDPAAALGSKQKQKLQPHDAALAQEPRAVGGKQKMLNLLGQGKAPPALVAGKAKAKADAKAKAKAKAQGKAKGVPEHKYLDNGLLQVNPKGQHPVYDLLAKGKEIWEGKLDKASQTLGQAVNEYRRRYGRAPPKGFDRWWEYAQKHNVQLPDEYDQIHKDLDPFHALPPAQIQSLIKTASARYGMYTIYCPGAQSGLDAEEQVCVYDLNEEGLTPGEVGVAKQRADAQMSLLEDIGGLVEEVEAVFYSHDVPWQFVGHEYAVESFILVRRMKNEIASKLHKKPVWLSGALEDAAAVGEYLNTEEHDLDWAHLGWPSACAPHKPLRKSYDMQSMPELEDLWAERSKSFIWDHKAAMDPCIHPTIVHLQGFLSGHGKGPGPSKELYPVMAMCKTTLHSDVLAVSMENWTEDVGEDPPWEDKVDDRMLWRGKNTGIFFKPGVPWEISQRINLLSRTAQTSGDIPVLPLTPFHKPIGAPRNTPIAELNRELMDVAFVDEPIQCEAAECERVKKEYRYGGRVDWQGANAYKYMLDIDGNGWSARFKRLMSTNSVILKSTIFPEWYTDRIQPWIHYIPLKSDLTDLYDVLTFFRGGPEHDKLAKRIAVEGKIWSKTFWRKEDMVSYQFRLFLELSRLQATDREAASFTIMGSELDE